MGILIHAFKRDLDDPDRTNFKEYHLEFYYKRYFDEDLDIKLFGVNNNTELCKLVSDTVFVNDASTMLEVKIGEDTPFELLLKITEDERRSRIKRLVSGDETAALTFRKPAEKDVK